MLINIFIELIVEFSIFKFRLKLIVFPNEFFDGFFIGIKCTNSHPGVYNTSDCRRAFHFIAAGRNAKYIGKHFVKLL